MITSKEIEKAIDKATELALSFTGTTDELVVQVINPLQLKLREGIKAGLRCDGLEMICRFQKMETAVKRFV